MNREMRHITLLLILCFQFTGFSQEYNIKYTDSIIGSFNAVEGTQRIHRIADYIRNENFHQVDHTPFKPFLKEAYKWEKDHPDPRLLNTIRLGHVNMLIAEEERVSAVELLTEILHSGVSMPQKDSVSTYSFLCDIYLSVEANAEAWKMRIELDKILSNVRPGSKNYDRYTEMKLSGRAMVLLRTKQYRKSAQAFQYYLDYLSGKNSSEAMHHRSGAYNNLGLVYLYSEMPDSAIFCFEESMRYWRDYLRSIDHVTTNDSAFIDLLYGNIASAYNLQGKYSEAIPLLMKDLRSSRNINNTPGIISSYHELSESYLGLRQYAKAISFLDSAAALLDQGVPPNSKRKNLSIRVKVLEKMGKAQEALNSYKELVAFNDSMDLVKNKARSSVMQVVYEVEEKNREINAQKLMVAEAESEAEEQRGMKRSLTFGILLMLVVVIILVVNTIQRKKRTAILKEKNKQIEDQNTVIESALREKDMLLKEIHHRVKNNLQLISGILELQAVKFDDENVKIVMEEGQSRVRSMALIHQQLYQSDNLGEIDFKKYVEKLVNDIVVAFNDKNLKITTSINTGEFSFDVNTAVPLGLIINELVTNALKHGFKGRNEGRIEISIEADNDSGYILKVGDDGNGLPEDFDPEKINSLGLRLVKGLSRQIGGRYSYKSDKGTHFTIKFQNNKYD